MASAPHDQISAAIRQRFVAAGLKPTSVGLSFRSDGKVLTVAGFYGDGRTPFALSTPPFHNDPIDRADAMVSGLIAARHGSAVTSFKPQGVSMGKLGSFAARVKETKAKLEGRADDLAKMASDVESRGDAALDKHEAVLKAQAAEVADLERSIVEMTNGGPA